MPEIQIDFMRIPEIPDALLNQLATRIKPIVRKESESRPYYIHPVDLKKVAYTWNPTFAGPASNLKALTDIITFHSFGYHGLFKPSIAEVLAQIPELLRHHVTAFEIVESPIDSSDLQKTAEYVREGYHRAITRLYVDRI